jgi:gliding motility-associated-like protein
MVLFNTNKAQFLYYQDTYKGGISMDGKSYYGQDYLHSDTIKFVNTVPAGSVIKKAYLISDKLAYYYGTVLEKDNPIPFIFNNHNITIDSTNQVAPFFNNSVPLFLYNWIIVKDVTTYALFNNNQLITPCQSCLITSNQTNFVYDGFLLVLLYENNTMPVTNAVVFLNDQNSSVITSYTLNNINPIDNTKDVALSINSNYIEDSLLFTLNSSHSLGYLRPHADGNITKLPGSFYYQNNTLFGLQDDVNSPFIDTTDALANIKTYISNNTANLSLVSQGHTQVQGDDAIEAFILAYSTPCPPHGITPTQSYTLCNSTGKTLTTSSSNTLNTSYSWFATDGSLSTVSSSSVAVTPTVTTNYIAYVDSVGCKHTEHFSVSVIPNPKIDSLNVMNAVCGNFTLGSVGITAHGGTLPYSYSIDSINQTGNGFSNIAVGNYTATVTDSNNCFYQKPFIIKEVNLANANFIPQPDTGCVPATIYFNNTSTHTNANEWYINDDSLNTQSPGYTFADTGTYIITLISWSNLRICSDTITKTICVKDCPPDSFNIIVPNIFSPNGDDINDTWQPIVHNFQYTVNSYTCIIYDRWGIKVFETNNIAERWSGRSTSGIACSAGSYFYILGYKVTGSGGEVKEDKLKGFIELTR